MIKHIVFWKVKDAYNGQSKQEIMQQIKTMLEHCGQVIPGVIELEMALGGQGLEATFDVAMYSVFKDKAALDAYQVHPEHEKVKAYIGQVKTARECMDYEV
ncbi:MAG: Dabb family protein [Limnobacter sp.]|nr:Dabb family protein [Limnobacter sp.]